MAAKYAIKHSGTGLYYEKNGKKWTNDLSAAQLCDSQSGASRAKSAAIKNARQRKSVRQNLGKKWPLPKYPPVNDDMEDEVEVVKIVVQEAPEG